MGRTKHLSTRLNQHKRRGKNKDLTLAYYYAELTWAEARGLEEYEMIKNNTRYTGNNAIRGISPVNPNLIPYTFAADNYIKNKFINYLYDLSELFMG